MLKDQLHRDATQALKEGNKDLASVLRLALAAIAAKEKEKRYREKLEQEALLTDEEVIDVLASEIKKRNDAIALYEKGNRPELVQREQAEIEALKRYLPEQLSAADLAALAAQSVAAVGAQGIKDMGKVMADLSPKIKGKASGSDASAVVKKLLTEP